MTAHLTEAQLNDYVDDVLPAGPQQVVEAHVAACAVCQAELQALRALIGSIRSLPREVAPARDLLTGVHRARAVDQHALRIPRGDALWSMRRQLAAAAMLLIVVTAVITHQAVSGKNQVARRPASDALLVSSELRGLEQRYRQAIGDLQELFALQRATLSPQTRMLLEENLRIIDRAISESRAALAEQPDDPVVSDLLRGAYEKKLDVLRRATAAART